MINFWVVNVNPLHPTNSLSLTNFPITIYSILLLIQVQTQSQLFTDLKKATGDISLPSTLARACQDLYTLIPATVHLSSIPPTTHTPHTLNPDHALDRTPTHDTQRTFVSLTLRLQHPYKQLSVQTCKQSKSNNIFTTFPIHAHAHTFAPAILQTPPPSMHGVVGKTIFEFWQTPKKKRNKILKDCCYIKIITSSWYVVENVKKKKCQHVKGFPRPPHKYVIMMKEIQKPVLRPILYMML